MKFFLMAVDDVLKTSLSFEKQKSYIDEEDERIQVNEDSN
jgi:hypothetical protein